MIRLLALAALATALVGCGPDDAPEKAAPIAIEKTDLAQQVAAKFTPTKKAGKLDVTCPQGLEQRVDAVTDCSGTSDGKNVGLRVTTTKVDGADVEFDVLPFVPANDVAGTIIQSLEMQGYQGVGGTCDTELLGEVGQKAVCTITTEGGETIVDVEVSKVTGWLVDFTFKS